MKPLVAQSDRIGSILNRPEFAGMRQFMLPVPAGLPTFITKQFRLSIVPRLMPTWNVGDMVDGLNRILEIRRGETKFHYDIWSDTDKTADPRKKETALFHFPARQKGPFVLVCAGGAYASVASIVEAFPVAAELNRLGYTAFVLHYRCGKNNAWPAPIEDLQQALHFILKHADKFGVEKDHYAAAGFSAGGHLVASLGTQNYGYQHWNLLKPGALFLAYPVTMYTHMTKIHQVCRDNLLGISPTKSDIDDINVVLNADNSYPPVFLMHCQDDDQIYFENSEALAQKLKSIGVPCILKPVPKGGHGIGLGSGTAAQGWLAEAVQFWRSNF
jgi:acetyl esterase/lipase